MVNLIVRPDRLLQRVEAIQTKERRSLARAEKAEKKQVSERLWEKYKAGIGKIRERQKQERFGLVAEREAQLRTIVTFELARESLIAGREAANANQPAQEKAESAPAEHFNTAVTTRSPSQTASIEKIKRQMEEWRKRAPGRDFGREM